MCIVQVLYGKRRRCGRRLVVSDRVSYLRLGVLLGILILLDDGKKERV